MLSKLYGLVVGGFDNRLKPRNHPFRGSSNQCIIDVQKSLKAGK